MARTASSAAKTQVERLERANLELKHENEELRLKLIKKGSRRGRFARGLVIFICVLLAALILAAGNVLFWAGNTLINTDKYVATVQPLMADKTVQAAVAGYTTNQIFSQVDVQAFVSGSLPPRAEFLAPQLTSQLKSSTDKTLQKTLASDRFQTLWVNTNRKAQQRLVHAVKTSKTSDGVINLQDVYDRLGESLKGTKLNFLSGKTLPPKAGSITVINAPWLPKARFAVNNIGWLKPAALFVVTVLSLLAIWLARSRRRLVISLGLVFAFTMACTLVLIHIAEKRIAGHAQPVYQAAVRNAADIILQPLAHQSWAILAVSLLISIIAWLSGPYRAASALVSSVRRYITTPAHRLVFKTENDLTTWVADYRDAIEWVTVAVIALVMILVRLSFALVVAYGLLILLAVLAVEILTSTHSERKR